MAKKPTKKVTGMIKLQIEAGKANPSPPIGPALGQRGVNIMEFCKAFNAKTQDQAGMILPVVITVFEDRSFTFITKTPPATQLIKKAIKLEKGSSAPGPKGIVGKITRAQLESIAKIKQPDLTAASMGAAINTIGGSARSMGVEVVD